MDLGDDGFEDLYRYCVCNRDPERRKVTGESRARCRLDPMDHRFLVDNKTLDDHRIEKSEV